LLSLFEASIKQINCASGFIWGDAQESKLCYYEVENCGIVNSTELRTGEVKVFGRTGIDEIDNRLECILQTTYRNLSNRGDLDVNTLISLLSVEYTKRYRKYSDTVNEPYTSPFLVSAKSDGGKWIAFDTEEFVYNSNGDELSVKTNIEFDRQTSYGIFKVTQDGEVIMLRSIMEWEC
jgi:hypothetical protein